jgi:hypothetical protein
MERIIQALIKNSPLALIILGILLLVLVAAGGWTSQGVVIQETGWRIAVAAMGVVVATLGGLLLWRSHNSATPSPDQAPAEKYGVRISDPPNNSILGSRFELKGTYDKKPPSNGCAIFSVGVDRHYHFQQYINFENNTDRSWSATLKFNRLPGRRIIKVVELGRAGQALVEYQRKLQHAGYWIGIETLTPDVVVCASITIEWKPKPDPVQHRATTPSP